MKVHSRLEVNYACGWRMRVGRFLRELADRIDGRRTFAVRHVSTPAIGQETVLKAVELGMVHAANLLADSVVDAAFDEVLALFGEPERPVDGAR